MVQRSLDDAVALGCLSPTWRHHHGHALGIRTGSRAGRDDATLAVQQDDPEGGKAVGILGDALTAKGRHFAAR